MSLGVSASHGRQITFPTGFLTKLFFMASRPPGGTSRRAKLERGQSTERADAALTEWTATGTSTR